MTVAVSFGIMKAQLRLSAGETQEDALLERILAAAIASCAAIIDRTVDDLTAGELPIFEQAVLVMATGLFEDRAGAGGTPAAVTALLRPLRNLGR